MNARPLLLALLLIGPSAQVKDVTVQVNGRSVRLDIALPARPSATRPTIVFESGFGTPGSGDFAHVLPLLSRDLRTIRYEFDTTGRDSADQPTMESHRRFGTLRLYCTMRWPLLASRRRTSWLDTRLAARGSGCLPASTPTGSPASCSSTPRPTSPGRPMMMSTTSFFPLDLDRKHATKCARCRSPTQRRRNQSILAESAMASAMSAAGFP